ncbi:hypothetical protein ES703_17405 [subsurface metagenome]
MTAATGMNLSSVSMLNGETLMTSIRALEIRSPNFILRMMMNGQRQGKSY